MSSITQVSDSIQTMLKSRAKELERQTGFVERTSAQLDGPAFAQTTVLTWMQTAEASDTQVRHTAASVGVHVSNQAIEQRFGEGSARLLRALLEEAVAEGISSEASAPELLARFNGVYLQDGTIISVPASLSPEWPGRGSVGQQAALRVQGRLALQCGYGLFHPGPDASAWPARAVVVDASQGHAEHRRCGRAVLGSALVLTRPVS